MQENDYRDPPAPKLWTKDFTIITLGSVVSMLGNALSGFALSLMVLDYSDSGLLYALYIMAFTFPQLITPLFSGAILDRFSRKKTIYSLDFLSAGLYLLAALILWKGWFSYPLFLVYCVVIGTISSVYMVAYDSFYPLLIDNENYSKAYSVASVLETLAAVMVPVSAFLYNQIGMAPLMAVNAVCFFAAAVMETKIGAEEDYIRLQKENAREDGLSFARRVLKDIREGIRYLYSEKGLLAVTLYFVFSFFGAGVSSVLILPYFKNTYPNGEYIYMLVWGMSVVGRVIGGAYHYKVRMPKKKKYVIALTVYILLSLIDMTYLFLPIPFMMALCFLNGLGGITSYTIRISATQNHVPDEKKGRFNGAFQMLTTGGNLLGELAGGLLTLVLPQRAVVSLMAGVVLLAALVFIGGNRKAVEELYNI